MVFVSVQCRASWASPYNLVWTRQLGTSEGDFSYSVVVDSENNVYISGYTNGALPPSPNADAFLTNYDSFGTKLWTKQLGTNDSDTSRTVAVDSNNCSSFVAAIDASHQINERKMSVRSCPPTAPKPGSEKMPHYSE